MGGQVYLRWVGTVGGDAVNVADLVNTDRFRQRTGHGDEKKGDRDKGKNEP